MKLSLEQRKQMASGFHLRLGCFTLLNGSICQGPKYQVGLSVVLVVTKCYIASNK